jgi:hypothetical protein
MGTKGTTSVLKELTTGPTYVKCVKLNKLHLIFSGMLLIIYILGLVKTVLMKFQFLRNKLHINVLNKFKKLLFFVHTIGLVCLGDFSFIHKY